MPGYIEHGLDSMLDSVSHTFAIKSSRRIIKRWQQHPAVAGVKQLIAFYCLIFHSDLKGRWMVQGDGEKVDHASDGSGTSLISHNIFDVAEMIPWRIWQGKWKKFIVKPQKPIFKTFPLEFSEMFQKYLCVCFYIFNWIWTIFFQKFIFCHNNFWGFLAFVVIRPIGICYLDGIWN